ncbi:MAG TPA: hypothetical protein VEY71_03490, partial [Chitinophagales bacterium]|nr:hypothetical protein [Chitinophagales bacterium]
QHGSEERLISCLKRGDEQAFGEFYDRYAPLVLGIVSKSFAEQSDAERVLQLVLTEVWRDKSEYHDTEPLLFWLMKKVRAHILKVRQNTAGAIQASEQNVSLQPDAQHDPDRLAAAALEMMYLKGCNLNEAAAALNVTPPILLPMIRQFLCSLKPSQL